MTTLRVHVAAPPAGDEAIAWGLFDGAGVCTRTGRTVASEWPAADRVEAVLAASHVRIATVTLPPLLKMPPPSAEPPVPPGVVALPAVARLMLRCAALSISTLPLLALKIPPP